MSCGWHLAQAQIFITSPSMKLLVEWTPGIVLFYQFFTHSQDATPSHFFGGRGEKTAWKIWQVFPDVTEAFEHLLLMVDNVSDLVMSVLERFVVLLYDRTSDQVSVNNARKLLFTQKSRSLENLPPQHRLHLYNITNEQDIERIARTETCFWSLVFQAPKTGDGKKTMWDGNLCGLLCQKLLSPVMN